MQRYRINGAPSKLEAAPGHSIKSVQIYLVVAGFGFGAGTADE